MTGTYLVLKSPLQILEILIRAVHSIEVKILVQLKLWLAGALDPGTESEIGRKVESNIGEEHANHLLGHLFADEEDGRCLGLAVVLPHNGLLVLGLLRRIQTPRHTHYGSSPDVTIALGFGSQDLLSAASNSPSHGADPLDLEHLLENQVSQFRRELPQEIAVGLIVFVRVEIDSGNVGGVRHAEGGQGGMVDEMVSVKQKSARVSRARR